MSVPPKLKPGDEIRVLALSRSLGGVMKFNGTTEQDIAFATARLEAMGLKVTFGRHVRECNEHLTASPERRLEDLHSAIVDPSVKGILAVSGGKVASCSIGLTNVAETPLWAEEAAKILTGSSLDAATVKRAVAAAEAITAPSSDARGPAAYRTKMAGVMLSRALARAKANAR